MPIAPLREASPAPEPFASLVDVLTAGQRVEDAIHAATGEQAQAAMDAAAAQLDHAAAYFRLAGAGFSPLAGTAGDLARHARLLGASAAQAGGGLPSFQSGALYGFQGPLGALYRRVRRLL